MDSDWPYFLHHGHVHQEDYGMARIVIIEDEWAIREVMKDILAGEGHEVQDCANGREGLDVIIADHPDLAICDIRMPEMDGYEVLSEVRSRPDTQATLFIYLTAQNDRAAQRRGMELGADDFITKPFHVEELIKAINTQLAKRETLETKVENTISVLRRNIVYALPHELRTPLSLIMGNADLLAEDLQNLDHDTILEMVDSIRRSSMRLHELFEDYLTYAQIELAAANPRRREALRSHIIRDASLVITTTAEQIAREYDRPGDLQLSTLKIALQMSEDNLRKIVREVVENAFKFSPAGSPVSVTARRETGVFALTVEDRGRGMNPAQIEQIGAYMQFERTIYEQQGLGLGLVIARGLAELHNGTLNIESSPHQGTTVQLEIPIYG
ncbi:MAG: hybrid sensor histidine kinase/response regulator [Anaerolineae bacterium]|nr:hybrid sensor histidine kinase/response regulator [Anaerolineae bacterium]